MDRSEVDIDNSSFEVALEEVTIAGEDVNYAASLGGYCIIFASTVVELYLTFIIKEIQKTIFNSGFPFFMTKLVLFR